jgi:hypothetical protein
MSKNLPVAQGIITISFYYLAHRKECVGITIFLPTISLIFIYLEGVRKLLKCFLSVIFVLCQMKYVVLRNDYVYHIYTSKK